MILKLLPIIIILLFLGCEDKKYHINEKKSILKKSFWEDLPQDYLSDNALDSFKKSCQKKPPKYLLDVCQIADSTPVKSKEFFQTYFTPYSVINEDESEDAFFTGYYEATLYGSKDISIKNRYPIYTVPDDLLIVDLSDIYSELKSYRLRGRVKDNRVVSYPSREDIEKDGLKEADIICYVNDKIDLFFLQVQGSGRVILDNNQSIFIGYAQQNGHPYRSIGKYMIDKGYLTKDEVSLQTIKEWLNNNPKQIDEVLNFNPSYIFFTQKNQSATGSMGAVLTPMHSVAVDPNYFDYGVPLIISTINPIDENKELNSLVITQDRGGAIKGDLRFDIFFGYGKLAQKSAGLMKHKGKVWMLLPKNIKLKKIN